MVHILVGASFVAVNRIDELCFGDIQDLADAHGFDWHAREQAAAIEILGPSGTYEALPEWRQCDLIDGLESDAIGYLKSHFT